MSKFASLTDGSVDEWKAMLDTNVLGFAICTREAIKSMKEKGIDDGHLVTIGSTLAHYVIPRGGEPLNLYCGTKFAARALTKGTRNEVRLAGKNFRVTHISAARDPCTVVSYMLIR